MQKRNMAIAILAGFSLAGISRTTNAGVIYSDNFDGAAGTVSGRTPDQEVALDGGSQGVTWTSDATATTNPDAVWTATGGTSTGTDTTFASIGTLATGADANLITNAFLPFTPQAGFVYDLHMDLDPSATGASGNWLGLGFAQAGLNGHTAGGASSALSNDNTYGLTIVKGSGVIQAFGGLGTGNAITLTPGTTTAGVFTGIDIILDTTGATDKVSIEVNGTTEGSFTYATNPNIGDVVFGTNKLTGEASNFSLSDNGVPEPASLGLLSLGLLGVMRRNRRR